MTAESRMRHTVRLPIWPALLAFVVVLFAAGCGDDEDSDGSVAGEEKVSSPGEYQGYSSAQYTGFQTSSVYVTMRDEVRLAVDIHLPTGGPAQSFPVLLMMTPYHRASVLEDGTIQDPMSSPSSGYRVLSSYGYAIVVADVRGTGASFGTRYTIFSPEEAEDGDDLIDWIVAQPWCDGNVGMMGQSYLATMQYLAAAYRNPHLKAIIPRYTLLDIYDVVYPQGILDANFIEIYDVGMLAYNLNIPMPSMGIWPCKPVDEDVRGILRFLASFEHLGNFGMMESALTVPYRDDLLVDPWGGAYGFRDLCPAGYLDAIEDSGVAIYNMGGWYEPYVRDTISFQETLGNRDKILIGPYDHRKGFEGSTIEYLRFFDRYLKGIPNGIDEEPPYYIRTIGTDEWRFLDAWPLPEQVITPYYFGPGNELTTSAPLEDLAVDTYEVDYSTYSAKETRWMSLFGTDSNYDERAEQDLKCLAYTTAPLTEDLEVTGHPILYLYVTSTAEDGDFFVYLEDLHEDGFVEYVTEGLLRASMRRLSPRPWAPELPWHSCYRADAMPLVPGETAELVIDLYPTSKLFRSGHRIRIAIAGADDGNFDTPVLSPAPTLRVFRDRVQASRIDLPIVP
ncbi:MAG: CocE/NonD family hydrolase [bacterium]